MRLAHAPLLVCAELSLLVVILPRPVAAAWPDPTVNVSLCTAPNNQYSLTAVSDGVGGAVVTWEDQRDGDVNIYAQRISVEGMVFWATDGVPIHTALGIAGILADPSATTSDGAGGAIVTWVERHAGYTGLYAQRISVDGTVLWGSDGVAICAFASYPAIASDGVGGAIIIWSDGRFPGGGIYAQRISADGTIHWAANGVRISQGTAPLALTSDGASGAVVVSRVYSSISSSDMYAQRISADGTVLWHTAGVALSTARGSQSWPAIVSDGASGAIVAWEDERDDDGDIYAQRIAASGMTLWADNGVPVCLAPGAMGLPVMISDGNGGAIATWSDARNGPSDIYTQRISAAGAPLWMDNGVALCSASGAQGNPAIVSDGVGGAIVTWDGGDTFAQRISATGTPLWTGNGVAVCSATGNQVAPTIVSDGIGGAIVAWQDLRNGNFDIYAQRVLANGQLGDGAVNVPPGDASLELLLGPVRPNPSRGSILTLQFTLASNAPASLDLFDVAGRRIATYEVGSLGAGQHIVNLAGGRKLRAGIYLVGLKQSSQQRTARAVVLD